MKIIHELAILTLMLNEYTIFEETSWLMDSVSWECKLVTIEFKEWDPSFKIDETIF